MFEMNLFIFWPHLYVFIVVCGIPDPDKALPDAIPPVGKIYPFSKIFITFEPIQQFR